MLTDAISTRRQRGLEIAATSTITRTRKGAYLVPSQTLVSQTYTVAKTDAGFECDCPDYELRREPCKHVFATEYYIRRETRPDGTVVETRAVRMTYPQNWKAYNAAQVTEKARFCALLRDLVADVPSPEQKRGRPALPLSDMIFAACFKVYSTVSGRRFMTDLKHAAQLRLIERAPHYNSIFNVLDRKSVTPILEDLILRSALPLKALETDFAVDSTGFGTQMFYRHFSAKYGKDKDRRSFVKLHAMIGTKTNVITYAAVSDEGDSPMLPRLVTPTADQFDVQRVSADKAYGSRHNFAVIESCGAAPYVPFKNNAVLRNDSPTWNRLFHYFSFHRDEFLSHYHRRSNAESTFSAIKRKFGDTIRSKSPVAQRNEALLKVLCHNLVCVLHEVQESGATAQFPALSDCCPKNTEAAQETLGFD